MEGCGGERSGACDKSCSDSCSHDAGSVDHVGEIT
jgi:hypothetical protein